MNGQQRPWITIMAKKPRRSKNPTTGVSPRVKLTAEESPNGTREFSVVIERDEEGYLIASVPSLPGCHTQARSLDDLMDRVREAIALCLDVAADSDKGLEFVGVQRVRVPA
jgi:predicted RNase H-like HicB family nuclease